MATFLDLPYELQTRVVERVHAYNDLQSLCLTCKSVKNVVTPVLYREIRLYFPQDETIYRRIGAQPLYTSQNMKFVQSIAVFNSIHYGDSSIYDGNGVSHRRHDAKIADFTSVVNWLVVVCMRYLGSHQLRKFRWYHRFPLMSDILDKYVLGPQCKSLQCLHISAVDTQIDSSWCPDQQFDNLTDFECRISEDTLLWLKFIFHRPNTSCLQRVCIGDVSRVLESHTDSMVFQPDEMMKLNEILEREYDENEGLFTEPPRIVQLLGLNLSPNIFRPSNWQQRLFSDKLQRLVLESCSDNMIPLSLLASRDSGQLSLKEFVFRHEEPFRFKIKNELENFLASFDGLALISILLDNSACMPDISLCLTSHRKTLRQLVWESRSSRRNDWRDTSTRGPQNTNDLKWIADNCEGLHELGISIDWEGYPALESITDKLTKLSTLHIRNCPSMPRSRRSQISSAQGTSYVQGMANQLMAEVAHYEPNWILKVLAVGSRLYSHQLNLQMGRDRADRPTPAAGFAKVHYYIVRSSVDAFGRKMYVLTTKGRYPEDDLSLEDIQEETSHTRVFESTWLR